VQRELEATKRRLEELNEEKTGLMRMAAHDLRNPLNGLMLNIEILSEHAEEQNREPLDRMMILAHQMIHMIRNLLDVQALEDGRRRLNIEEVEVTGEVDAVVEAMQTVAERKRITISTQFARTAPRALADRAALRQVLNNLVGNAVKYSPYDREVVVEVEPARGGVLVLRVRDQGPGITPDEMPRLFQKYVCLSARPTGGEQSTGLGLAIVKQLVTAMNGTVWCESKPGAGAVFIVSLPAVAMAVV
jgi:signal transduction histidine kinase